MQCSITSLLPKTILSGRFGNQADQFLGALNFARLLDRTLVLPHWIEYPKTSPGRSVSVRVRQSPYSHVPLLIFMLIANYFSLISLSLYLMLFHLCYQLYVQLQIPFDDYFLVDPLLDYHRVILMADFMDRVAPLVWPAEERTGAYTHLCITAQ